MSAIDSLPDFLKPSLKLFMSVDLVGSTKLKHDEDVLSKKDIKDDVTLDSVGANWFSSLIDFYSGFEQKFTEQWQLAFTSAGISEPHWKSDDTPSLWKINGDELIYVLTIHNPWQIVVALYAWKKAVLSYRRHLNEMKVRLDVKATAWMAGFPISNHEVAFWRELSNAEPDLLEHAGKFGQYYRLNELYKSRQQKGEVPYVKDYIGPSVDTGFRISKFADTRRFPVSLEIVYFLSKISYDDAVKSELGLHFYGLERMKGVLGGAPYPIFWIDTTSPDDELISAQDKLKPHSTPCDILDIRKYIDLFFNDEKNMLFMPFIHNCDDKQFCTMPEPYEALLIHTAEIWEKEQNKIAILEEVEADGSLDDGQVEKVDDEQLSKLFSKN